VEHTLPESISIGRLFEALHIGTMRDNPLFDEEIGALPIQSIALGQKVISTHFSGVDLGLEPQGALLRVFVRGKNREELSFIQTLPADWQSFGEQVISWVEREQGRILVEAERFQARLTELIIQGQEFSVLHELRKRLGLDIFLVNKQLKVVAWEGGGRLPINPVSFVTPKLSQFRSLELAQQTPLSAGDWNDAAYKELPLSWYPLSDQQGVLGYIGLAAKQDKIGQVGRFFLYKAAGLLYLELSKVQSIEDTERQHYRDFLFDLLYNNFDSLEVMQTRGKLWGIDLTKPHLIAVGEISGYDPDSSDSVFFQEVLNNISLVLRNHPRTIFLERNDQLVFLFPLDTMLPLSQWHTTAKQLLTPFLNLPVHLPMQRSIIFGVGNICASARNIHRSFQEAKSALELGQLFNLNEKIVSFNELGVMRLLLKLEQQELEDFRTEVLGALLKYDQENNLHLEETLLSYLAADGDLNLAGDRLFLHPNTLRYRLKKAAEVLDLDLTSLENRMNLYIALKIGRLKALWHD
jgi:sugar diacid utilization regulator